MRQAQTKVRVEDDRGTREDDEAPDARRAARNEGPARSGAQCRETQEGLPPTACRKPAARETAGQHRDPTKPRGTGHPPEPEPHLRPH